MPQGYIGVGDAAPNLELLDMEGKAVRLSDFWEQGLVALVFLRTFA